MTQRQVRDLLHEASQPKTGYKRNREISQELVDAATEACGEQGIELTKTVGAFGVYTVFRQTQIRDRSLLIGLFPFFAFYCTERGKIDFSLM